MLTELWRDETGLTTVEYALLMVLVAVVAATVWAAVGASTGQCAANAGSSLLTR